MRRILGRSAVAAAAGAVAAGMVAVPAVIGLSGNPSFSEHAPARVPSVARVVRFEPSMSGRAGGPTLLPPRTNPEPMPATTPRTTPGSTSETTPRPTPQTPAATTPRPTAAKTPVEDRSSSAGVDRRRRGGR